MVQITEVRALPGHRLFVRFADDVRGEVDLSHLVGQGVFEAWRDEAFFAQVHLGEHGQIAWSDQIDLCPDAIYMQITGRSVSQVLSKANGAASHA